MSEATGVDIPSMPDVLPPGIAEQLPTDTSTAPPSRMQRTFSKRGARLGIHMSILDLGAHEAPYNLKRKWIQAAHLKEKQGHSQPGKKGVLTALPELSRISEVDTVAGSRTNLSKILLETPTAGQDAIEASVSNSPTVETPTKTPEVPSNTPASDDQLTTHKSRSSTMSSKIRRVMSRMSLNNFRSPTQERSQSAHRSSVDEASPVQSIKEGNKDDEVSTKEEGRLGLSDATNKTPTSVDRSKWNRRGQRPFLELIKLRFEKSPLNTSDIEKEFEYNHN